MTLFKSIRERYENVSKLPFKHFPIYLIGKGEKTKLINEFTQLGLEASNDIPRLLEALDLAVESFGEISRYRIEGVKTSAGTVLMAREALEKIRKLSEEK